METSDDVLDWKEDEILTFDYGFIFPPNIRFIGYTVLLAGLLGSMKSLWVLPISGIIGGWLSFRRSGVQIKPMERLRREYTSLLFKRGKWKSYRGYPDMACLQLREGFSAYFRGGVELSDNELVVDLYLLSEDHRRRLILKRCKSKKEAEVDGQKLAEKLGLKWTVYSPVISERTRRRKR